MTYNFGGRQSGFCSSPVKEITLLEKLGHDVPIIIERCDVVLFQEVNAEWAPNIVASFPGTRSTYYAKEPTLLTSWNLDAMTKPTTFQQCRIFPDPEFNNRSTKGWCTWTLALARARWPPAPRGNTLERGVASP